MKKIQFQSIKPWFLAWLTGSVVSMFAISGYLSGFNPVWFHYVSSKFLSYVGLAWEDAPFHLVLEGYARITSFLLTAHLTMLLFTPVIVAISLASASIFLTRKER